MVAVVVAIVVGTAPLNASSGARDATPTSSRESRDRNGQTPIKGELPNREFPDCCAENLRQLGNFWAAGAKQPSRDHHRNSATCPPLAPSFPSYPPKSPWRTL